jgi:2-methylaconitate cis-trans-isomerase PrpF
MSTIDCSIIRGGSSKGIFLLERDLPAPGRDRDRLLLALMGGADARQIDGLGGGDPLTSKVAIIAPGQTADADLEYESIEVGLGSNRLNRGIMCGNLAAGVGLFALQAGLLARDRTPGEIRIHCRSNGKMIVARPLDAQTWGELPAGGGAAEVGLRFEDPAGAVTGRLLPLGEVVTQFPVAGAAAVPVSVVDAGTLYAFIHADRLGCHGQEAPAALDLDSMLRQRVEALRGEVMDRVNQRLGTDFLPQRLKVAMVCGPAADGGEGDLVVRILNPARAHKACAVSAGVCVAAAAALPGSIVNTLAQAEGSPWVIKIRHPTGVLAVTLHRDGDAVKACEVQRSARVLMRGAAHWVMPSLSAASLDEAAA